MCVFNFFYSRFSSTKPVICFKRKQLKISEYTLAKQGRLKGNLFLSPLQGRNPTTERMSLENVLVIYRCKHIIPVVEMIHFLEMSKNQPLLAQIV